MTDNSAIVTSFVKEFDQPAPDVAKLAAYFTEDAVYENVPIPRPSKGREEIVKVLGGMGAQMLSEGWEVKHQVATGDVVMNERIDRFKMGDKSVAIRVVGVFEMRDGKIAAWRDYFDMAEWQNQVK
jgi:limonene-1,2-epoxide hydrolase